MSLEILSSGFIFKNPKPHVRSLHAYFPSLVRFADGEMVCTVRLGQAMQAHDLRTYVMRSHDGGETWALEGLIYPGRTEMPNTDSARISLAADGTLVAFVIRQHRQRLDEGLNNPATGGYVEQDLLIARSHDRGRTWIGPDAFTAPLVGPCFEICAPITMLSNDAWLLSTSTWQDWDGYCPNGIRTLAFISHDHGASWPTYVNTMTNLEDEITYWESKMIQLHDGRVLVVAWAYDRRNKRDLPNQYVISSDGGETFSQPASTGLLGQTLTPLQLGDGRLLSAYRRMDRPGLWAVISHLEGDHWVNEDQHGLWGTASGGLVATTGNMVNNFARLQFGAPCLVDLGNGTVHVSFWAAEECLTSARWIKVKVT